MLLSKIMGGGDCHAMIFAAARAISTSNFLADLFWMLIRVDAFSLRKPGGNSTCLVFNLRVPPRVGAILMEGMVDYW